MSGSISPRKRTNMSATEQQMSLTYPCDICDYHYDTAVGCPDDGIAAGTAWEAIADDWVCPLCGAPKKLFSQAR